MPRSCLRESSVFTPVPPFATGNVPVTPGLGDAANKDAAVLDAKLIKADGLDVIPVPPLATGNVPEVICEALWLCEMAA